MDKFTLTEDHISLIKQLNIIWHTEYMGEGRLGIDDKRPFGNSDVVGDIAGILGIRKVEGDHEDFWPKGTENRALKVFKELEIALRVVLTSGSFEPGDYESEKWHKRWRRAGEKA